MLFKEETTADVMQVSWSHFSVTHVFCIWWKIAITNVWHWRLKFWQSVRAVSSL